MKRRIAWILAAAALLVAAGAGAQGYARWREGERRQELADVGMAIAPVYQYDYTQTMCTIRGEAKSVATSGCGATCLSMVITHLTGNASQTPQTLFAAACASGDYRGSGLDHAALERLADAHGVEYVWLGRDEGSIRQALRSGYPVIAHMGPGIFTDEGHYILLRGVTDDGGVVINDPNSAEYTWQTHDLADIIAQSKTETPFMICRAAEN